MQDELTTVVTDPQVNDTPSDINNPEVPTDDAPVVPTETEPSDYDKAWDAVDLNDTSILEGTSSEQQPVSPISNPLETVPGNDTTNGTNNNIGAFMADKPVLKYKGRDIPIDSGDELIALAQKGFSYESEMANLKPKKKALSIIDGIPLEVLQAVADINDGKKEAINYIKSQYGIVEETTDDNPFFTNDDGKQTSKEPEYKPEVKTENPMEEYWANFAQSKPVEAAKANEVYSGLDESFKAELYTPDVFPLFVASVETGEFEKAYPLAIKEKSLNPAITWLQAYTAAVQKVGTPTPVTPVPPVSATPPVSGAEPRQLSDDAAADRVWNDEAYFKELESKIFN